MQHVFESITHIIYQDYFLVKNGAIINLPFHRRKLEQCANLFNIPIANILEELQNAVLHENNAARLILTLGVAEEEWLYHYYIEPLQGQMGAPVNIGVSSYVQADVHSVPACLLHWQTTPMLLSRTQMPPYQHAMILLNSKGFIASTTIGNIVLCKNKLLLTPSTDNSAVPEFITNTLLSGLLDDYTVKESLISMEDLLTADEVFIVRYDNELIAPVQSIAMLSSFTRHDEARQIYQQLCNKLGLYMKSISSASL